MFSREPKKEKIMNVNPSVYKNETDGIKKTIRGYLLGALSMFIFVTGVYMYANVTAISRAANLYIYHREVLNNTKVMNNLVSKTFAIENLEVVVEGVKK